MEPTSIEQENGIAVQLSDINANEESENPLLGNESDDEKGK